MKGGVEKGLDADEFDESERFFGILSLPPQSLTFSDCIIDEATLGRVSRIFVMIRAIYLDSPPRRVEMRLISCIKYSRGPSSKFVELIGTQDITSTSVHATSKILSIFQLLATWKMITILLDSPNQCRVSPWNVVTTVLSLPPSPWRSRWGR